MATGDDIALPTVVHKASRKARSRRPSKSVPMIPFGTILKGKFELRDIIGAGGYGQIYKAYNTKTKEMAAVKVMTRTHEPLRMILEQQILKELNGKERFPIMHASGNHDSFMFIIMELLGRSLSDLRKRSERKRFEPPTAIRVGLQMVESLRTMHGMGFVHRDVKPGNMCVGGSPETQKVVYTVDFGLARQFRDKGKVRKRVHAGFRGTMRYVSLNVHEKKDQSPCDDLISLFYSVVEMSEGGLPWSRMKESDDIARRKKTVNYEETCRSQPQVLTEMYSYCYETCEDSTSPNYEQIIDYLKACLPEGYDMASPMSYEVILEMSTLNSLDRTNVDNDGMNQTQ